MGKNEGFNLYLVLGSMLFFLGIFLMSGQVVVDALGPGYSVALGAILFGVGVGLLASAIEKAGK